MDKISVIVPVFNGEKYIQKCLISIIHQKYSNIEVIVVDDGSTDHTAAIVKKIMKQDYRVSYFYQENSGVSTARNRGLKEVTGDFIAFVDADDTVDEHIYEVMLHDMYYYSADLVFCNFSYVDMDSERIMWQSQLLTRNVSAGCNTVSLKNILISGGYCCNKLVKAQLIKDIRFHEDIHMCEDLLFWFEALYSKKSLQLVYNSRHLYNYYIRFDSACREGVNSQDMSFMEAYRRMELICDSEELRRTIVYLYVNNIIGHIYKYYQGKHLKKNRDYLIMLKKELIDYNKRNNLAFKQKIYVILLKLHPRLANMMYSVRRKQRRVQ